MLDWHQLITLSMCIILLAYLLILSCIRKAAMHILSITILWCHMQGQCRHLVQKSMMLIMEIMNIMVCNQIPNLSTGADDCVLYTVIGDDQYLINRMGLLLIFNHINVAMEEVAFNMYSSYLDGECTCFVEYIVYELYLVLLCFCVYELILVQANLEMEWTMVL